MSENKPSTKRVRDRLKIIDEKLARLERQKLELQTEQEHLVARHAEPNNKSFKEAKALSVNQKVQLFKRLFKGRSDIFAKRWDARDKCI